MARDIAVHVTNRTEPFLASLYTRNPRSPDGLPTGAVGTHNRAAAKDIINAIKGIVGANDRVRVMRLVGHGNSGIFQFPDMWNRNMISPDYAQLRKVFSAAGRLEIHGCGVASETDIMKPGFKIEDANEHNTVPGRFYGSSNGAGLVYLKRVATVFNVPTTAAIDVQRADDGWNFEGDTVTVYPNGKFRMDNNETREWGLTAIGNAAKDYLETIQKLYIAKKLYVQARIMLGQLIKNYPNTWAASVAERLLRSPILDDIM